MIVLLQQGGERAVFDNVTKIEEISKFSGRKCIHLYHGSEILMGGDDIDLTNTTVTLLPNAEKEG